MFSLGECSVSYGLCAGTIIALIAIIAIGPGSRFLLTRWRRKRRIETWKRHNQTSIDLAEESPFECDSDGNGKHYQFLGCESGGTCLLIDFSCKAASLCLKLPDGRIFTLPEPSSTCNLHVEVLVPYSKWRITYNGFLRVHASNEMHVIEEYRHVILTIFWNAASDPIAWPHMWSTANLLETVECVDCESKLNKWLNMWRGFDQCGAMYGRVTIEGDEGARDEVVETNLPGVRRVRLGVFDDHTESNVTVVGASDDGCIFSLTTGSETSFGFVRWPNGDILPIEKSDATPLLADPLLDTIEINFSTSARTYSPSLRQQGKRSIHFADVRPNVETGVSFIATEINGSISIGMILRQQLTPEMDSKRPPDDRNSDYPSFESNISCDKNQLTVPFDSADCQNEELCGGKGSSLGFLTQLSRQSIRDFAVPDGFVLSSAAYNLQLNRNPRFKDVLASLEDIAHQRSEGSLQSACILLSDLFKSTEVHPDIVATISTGLTTLRNRTNAVPLKLAIRSSAIGEDGTEFSSAGQNDTFLAVADDIEHVTNAVRDCWASLFSHQSVIYRQQNAQPIRSAMAVVIQLMIPSESAGVLFTHFPVNNNPNKLLITANFGLGESVVSGKIDPDEFTVRRSLNDDSLVISDRKMGSKEMRIEMGGCGQAIVNRLSRNVYCLSDEDVLRLCRIGVYLEYCYGSPRDIEWAVHKGKIYLLQSRPMTSTTAFSTWELLHEFDTAVMSKQELCTFANVGEVMPEALSPFTMSTLIPAMDRSSIAQISPDRVSPLYLTFFTLSHWRITINVFNVFLYFLEPEISFRLKVLGMSVFGHEFVDQEIHAMAMHRNGVRAPAIQMLWDLVKAMWNTKKSVEKGKQFVDEYREKNDVLKMVESENLHALFVGLIENVSRIDYLSEMHGRASKIASFYQIIAFHILAEGKTELTDEIAGDVALILGSCQNVESAEVPVMLEKIVEEITGSGKRKEFNDAVEAADGMKWLMVNCPKAYNLLQDFLERHGHRAYVEFDFASVTWGMKPDLIIEMLNNSVIAGGRQKETKVAMSDREIVAALKSPKRSMTRHILKFMLPYIKTSVQLRERSKSTQVAYVHELRKGLRHLAHKMVQRGLLPHEDLLFYLTHGELGQVLMEHRVDLVVKAQRRQRAHVEFKKIRFEEFQRGVPQPMPQTIQTDSSTSRVKGTPVCGGHVNARACVVRDFSELTKINAGEILITRATDIAWSPYFPILAGVVTELGGLVSHGAVVAREYGLPCIVGATNATAIINDGDYIDMDAYTGNIVRIGNH